MNRYVDPMTQEEIFRFIVRECHLSFEQIANLNDHQISAILLLRDRKNPAFRN